MVRLEEWRGKEIFRRHGIPLPRGVLVRTQSELEAALAKGEVPFPAVVKAQVLAGGRGKGGAVRFADGPGEAREAVQAMLGMEFKGERVTAVLLEEKLPLDRELYLSITLDRSRREPVIMASASGGVEIESVSDEAIAKVWVHPLAGLVTYQRKKIAKALGLQGKLGAGLEKLLQSLWQVFLDEDAELVEVNPLAVSGERLVALDSKVIVEDDALFRHPEYQGLRGELTPLEEKAHEKGIAFVEIGGDIGVIANGAGLTMATLDVLLQEGGRPGVFLDLGGTDDPQKVAEAFLLMTEARPKVVFVNIFGGVTRCDTVARGLLDAMKVAPPKFPMVARIRGNNEKEGVAILKAGGVGSYTDLAESVRHVVALEQGQEAAAPLAGSPP
jgi:succinyl-CoA synthetase beta subunit